MNRHSLIALLVIFLLIGCVEHAREFVEVTTGGKPGNVTNVTNVTTECPRLAPVSPSVVESCLSKGGEMVSGADEKGCPLTPRCVIPEKPPGGPTEENVSLCGGPEGITCHTGMKCDINMSDPLLFGVCMPVEAGVQCGGPDAIQCPDGYECIEKGAEGGVCSPIVEKVEVTDFCWRTYGESDSRVVSINDCGSNVYRLGREGFGSDYAYTTEEGRLIAECGAFPEEKCDELYKDCLQVDNMCLLSPDSGLRRCPEDLTRINASTCEVYSPVCGMYFSIYENKTTLSWKEYPNSCYACYDRSDYEEAFGYRDGPCDRAMLSYCPSTGEECKTKEKVCAMVEENKTIKWKEFDSSCDGCSYFANKVTNNALNITNESILLERFIANTSAPIILGFRKGECAGGGAITECPPAFEGMEEISWYAPVCAKVIVGNETTEWRAYINQFSACAVNETGLSVPGYRLGEC